MLLKKNIKENIFYIKTLIYLIPKIFIMKKQFLFILFAIISSQIIFGQQLVILHTNDIHSRITGYGPESSYTPMVINNDSTLGGFARLATLISQERKKDNSKLLLVDAGDFLMGTVFHALEPETGFQLHMMKELGYDAVTFGNHEYDFGANALAEIVNSAIKRGGTPPLVVSYLKFSPKPGDQALEKLYNDKVIKPYIIIKRNGLKIGIFSLLGKDAQNDVKFAAPLEFTDLVKTAKKYTKFLRKVEKVDIVMVLSHTGFYPTKNGGYEGEDLNLAKKVPDIDIIISGHTHIATPKYIQVGKTIIVQTGCYLHNLGRLAIDYKNGKVTVTNFKLIPIDDKIKGDAKINAEIQQFKKRINKEIFNPLGFNYTDSVAETSFNMYYATYYHSTASSLGNLVSDAVKYYVDKYSTGTDVVLTAGGVIRDNIFKGIQSPADDFRVMSLGFGKHDYLGYPLVKIYITGHELKKLMELTIFSNKPGSDKFLYYSGLKVYYDAKGGFLNKVRKIEINGKQIDISKKNKKLYSLTTDSYIISFIGSIKKMSHGLIKIYPKNSKGVRITNYNNYILDFNKNKAGIQEGKQWIALIDYTKTFKDTNKDGIPDFPLKYKIYRSVFVPITKK